MADFATGVTLSFEVDDAELRAVRDDIESELGGVSVGVESRSAATDGGMAALGGDALEHLAEQTDLLDDILDEIEAGGVGGGAGGAGGGLLPFGGGGDGGGGFGIGDILTGLGISSLAGGAGVGTGGLLGVLGVTSIAAGAATIGTQLPAPPGSDRENAFEGGAFSFGIEPDTFNDILGTFSDAVTGNFEDEPQVGDANFDNIVPDPEDLRGPSPQFQQLIGQFDNAVSTTPAWLSRLETTVRRLTGDGAVPGPSDSGPLGRDAGSPSGSDRGVSAAERAIFSGDTTVDVTVEADAPTRREVERAMEQAKQDAVRQIEQQFRQSQRPGGG